MEIKDFTQGQTAYAVMTRRGKTTEHFIMRHTVKTVGRKYVHTKPINGGYEERFYKMREQDEYLTEREDWGSRLMLFPSEQAAQDYIEKMMLLAWFKQAAAYGEIEKYSLEQLRAVRAVLVDKENEEETESE